MKPINSADEFLAAADEIEGRTGAARLRRFAMAVEQGKAPTPEDLAAIAAAFRAILDGANPKNALRLAKRRGRPQGVKDGLKIALSIKRRIRKGANPVRGKEDACNEFGVSEETAERALEAHGESAVEFVESAARAEEFRQLVEEAARNVKRKK